MHVAGYIEEGTITTPFDMRVLNEIDRYHLVMKAIQMMPNLDERGTYLYELMKNKLVMHKEYIHEYGIDMPEIKEWKWTNED